MGEHDIAAVAAPRSDAIPLRFRERVRLRQGVAELLVFEVGEESFAVELRSVEEAVEAPQLRPVPDSPPGLLGVFTHRDQVLPLYSPRHVLGPPPRGGGVALVMRSGLRRVGLAVDDVTDVIHVSLSDLRDAPAAVNADDIAAGLVWTGRQLITVLDTRAFVGACATVALPAAV